MLRLIKLAILVALCIALVVMGVANMTPVTLKLLPDGIIRQDLSVPGVPLTGVILAAMLIGVVIGEIFEWMREHKHRRTVSQRGREIEQLRAENARLKAKLSDPREDLPRIAAH